MFSYFSLHFKNILENNFYIFIKKLPWQWKKTPYSTCIQNDISQSLLALRYPLRRRRLILGRSMESRNPLEEFCNSCFSSVYMHKFGISIITKIDIKK